jgi:rubrerythrin
MEKSALARPAANGSHSGQGESTGRSEPAADEMERETEADEEDVEAELEALLSFAQMDSEAAAAYEIAAKSMSDPRVVQMLRTFAEDHRRHVKDIHQLLTEAGGEVDLTAPDPEVSTFASMALTVSQLGTSAGLRTLIASEYFTNASYEAALELIAEPQARALLERNLRDEQRHIQALTQELARDERREEQATA